MRKKDSSFIIKMLVFLGLYLAVKSGYDYYSSEIMKLPEVPEGVFFFGTLFAVMSASFFSSLWSYLIRPVLTFLIIVPFISKGIYFGLDLLEIQVEPFMKINIYYASYAIAGSLATFGFFLIKKLIWSLLNLLIIKPIKFFYGGLDNFFRYVENWFFKTPDNVKCFMAEIDNIQGDSDYERGRIFEEIVAEAYNRMGYYAETTGTMRAKGTLPESIQRRGGSGEQGVDVLVKIPAHLAGNSTGLIMAVQCKLYKSKVDNKAVQEIVAALPLYGADFGVVVTNNIFTGPARDLAEVNGVKLVNRQELQQLMVNSYKKSS